MDICSFADDRDRCWAKRAGMDCSVCMEEGLFSVVDESNFRKIEFFRDWENLKHWFTEMKRKSLDSVPADVVVSFKLIDRFLEELKNLKTTLLPLGTKKERRLSDWLLSEIYINIIIDQSMYELERLKIEGGDIN